MIRLAGFIFLVLHQASAAEDLPALFSVTGVAADDVLNIRTKPDPSSTIIGSLAPDASGIEVIDQKDGWASINSGEQTGYVAARFLVAEGGAPWYRLESPILCAGTEPFWSFMIDGGSGASSFATADMAEPSQLPLVDLWPGDAWQPSAAASFGNGIAVLRAENCSDGMTERHYGIAIDVFLSSGGGHRISGCCSLLADQSTD